MPSQCSATKPLPTGSIATAKTMGISVVACLTIGTALPTVTIDLETNKLGSDLGVALWAAFRPAILDCYVTAFDPTEFAEASYKSSRPWSKARGTRTQKPNSWKLARLLRTRDKRPSSGEPASNREELASLHDPSHRGPDTSTSSNGLCITAEAVRRCPLWVKSRHGGAKLQCPLFPRKGTFPNDGWMSALCHKQT
jgi:hypothetical protein